MLKFESYQIEGFYDEMFLPDGTARPGAKLLEQKITSLSDGELRQRQQAAERALLDMGITFNVYGESDGTERIFPFDIIPRIVEAAGSGNGLNGTISPNLRSHCHVCRCWWTIILKAATLTSVRIFSMARTSMYSLVD